MTEPIHDDAEGEPGTPPDDDPQITDLVERIRRSRDPTAALIRPLSDEERGAIADQVIASLGARRAAPVPLRPKVSRLRAAWLVPMAAALAIAALFLLVPRGAARLVPYHLDVEGDADQRGELPDTGAPVRLRPETKLRVRLRPDQPARDVALRLIVVRDGKATVISPPAMADGQGGFTIEEVAGKLLGEQVDGPVELVFAVGRPLPDDDALARLALEPAAAAPASVRLERRRAVLIGFSPRHGALGWAGCKGVRAGPVCEVGRGAPLHVWAEGADAGRFSVRFDGREAPVRPTAIEGGLQWSVEPPAGAHALALTLGGREVLRLRLEGAPEAPLLDEAEALRRDDKLDAAEAKLDEAERDPAARLAALRLRARIARRRGDAARAAALRDKAIAADRAAGRVSDEVDDQLARVFDLLYREGALAEAKRRLDTLGPLDEGDAEDRLKLDHYRGLFASEVGDLRTAISALRAARRGAQRFAVPAYETAVATPLAELLSGLGRHDEAAAILAEMESRLAPETDRCDRAHLAMDHGWILLRSGRTAEAEQRLDEAARLAEEGCPRVLGDVLTNLAFARAEAGRAVDARALLARARAESRGPDARMAVWQERLTFELALAGDPRAALAAADEVRRAGEASLSPELLFEAELARARALDQLGDAAAAGRGYAAAEHALDAWSSLVPLGEGRAAFLERQERAARAWLDFLRREASRPGAGAPAAAELARAARRSVARFYQVVGDGDRAGALAADPDDAYAHAIAAYRAARAQIDASIAGGKPAAAGDLAALGDQQARVAAAFSAEADPSAPREGELSLVYHPLPVGWLGVAWTVAGVAWKLLGPVDPAAGPAALAATLLEPFRELVARARSIRVLAHHALASIAFHTLPWDGGVLLDHAPVLYGVALPARVDRPASTCGGGPAALVVADARENLPGASAAARAVEAALVARGYEVRLLRGDEARIAAVTRALDDPCVRLFHYEGHAVFSGRDGVDAALLLADGRLTATDILRLPRVAETAVLSGCSTAEADGLGLAQAFLARGAVEVLAAAAPVEDATAALVARRLYATPSPAGDVPPRLAEGWKIAFPLVRGDGARPSNLDAYRVLRR